MKRQRETLIAVVSDLHCGSTVGLCPPEPVPLDDGGAYLPTKAQGWLWSKWVTYWHTVKAKAKDRRLMVLLLGDLVDGDHHGTAQIVTNHPGAQVDILLRALALPMALQPEAVVVVRGTESHTGKLGAAEEATARTLAKQGLPVVKAPEGTFSWWHYKRQVGPLRLSATHHGRMGGRPWTRANVVSALAAQIFYEHAARGDEWPHLALRAHHHRYADSGDAHPVRVIQNGAFQLATSYVTKVAADSMADIGGLTVRVGADSWEVERHLFPPDLTPWRTP